MKNLEDRDMKREWLCSRRGTRSVLALVLLAVPLAGHAQGDAELAQELTNPVADLMTIPIQVNFDQGIGPADDGKKVTANVQPVIPFRLNENWNLVTRTVVPIIGQEDIFPGAGSQSGVGDVLLSLFLSPTKPTESGLIWGAGPVFLTPTGTDDLLTADKWGAGPTGVVLALRGPWTAGVLANHIWSFAGNGDRRDISNTFVQPFVSYTWPSAWTLSVTSESTYDWENKQWSVPLNVSVSKLVRVGKLPVSLQGGVGYWIESPDTGPEGFRFRLQVAIILPR